MLPVSFPWSMADSFLARYSLLFKLLASSLKANSYCDSRSQIGTRCLAANSEHLTPTTASNAGLMDASVRCGDVQREKGISYRQKTNASITALSRTRVRAQGFVHLSERISALSALADIGFLLWSRWHPALRWDMLCHVFIARDRWACAHHERDRFLRS